MNFLFEKRIFRKLLIFGSFVLLTSSMIGQNAADVATVLELALKNELVQSHFKKKIHIAKNSVFRKNLNDELKERGLRISNKVDLMASGVKTPVEIESMKLNGKKAKLVYNIDGTRFKYILKKGKEWKVRRKKQYKK